MTDVNCCFTLRIRPYHDDSPLIIIRAYDDLGWDEAGRVKLTCEVRQAGLVIFPRGQLYGAVHGTSDGTRARELVMALVAMAPDAGSGVDDGYWADYTESQLVWVNMHWEALDAERDARYCDESGGVL